MKLYSATEIKLFLICLTMWELYSIANNKVETLKNRKTYKLWIYTNYLFKMSKNKNSEPSEVEAPHQEVHLSVEKL